MPGASDAIIWSDDVPTETTKTKLVQKIERDFEKIIDTNIQDVNDFGDFNFDISTDEFWGM